MMLAKDKQKERAKVPMCVTDWVMLKLETGGGHSWKANPEIVFKIGRDVQVKEVPCLHISLGCSFHFVSAVDD